MNADERRLLLDKITETVINWVHQVSNTLGVGFVEKVYENALLIELREKGLDVSPQHRIEVLYKNVPVGEFIADLIVENAVVVEVKAVKGFDDVHAAQCLNYLHATGHPVCLLVNFGVPKAVVKRIVHNF